MGIITSEGIDQRQAEITSVSIRVRGANGSVQDARARLDEAAGLLAVVDYVLRADAGPYETAEALQEVFEQIDVCTANAAEHAHEISRQLPSDRDLRQTFS